MRRLGRYILNGFTVLSLLLCLAVGLRWWRGGPNTDRLVYNSPDTRVALIASPAGIEYFCFHWSAINHKEHEDNSQDWWDRWQYQQVGAGPVGSGFVYERDNPVRGGLDIGLPYWLVCLVTLFSPVASLPARFRRKRHRRGAARNHDCPGFLAQSSFELIDIDLVTGQRHV